MPRYSSTISITGNYSLPGCLIGAHGALTVDQVGGDTDVDTWQGGSSAGEDLTSVRTEFRVGGMSVERLLGLAADGGPHRLARPAGRCRVNSCRPRRN
ncbi:MAG: hypothetical protein U0231_03065 [Nitrospiraceae bacterium]